jgi:hypothetical protein
MTYTNYTFMVSQGPDSVVRASLNDVPFYRFDGRDPVTRSGPAIHLLQPGENVLEIEVDRAPDWSRAWIEIAVDFDHERPAAKIEWPALYADVPEKRRRLPVRHAVRFTPEGEIFTPVHLASQPKSFGCTGTPELHEAVRAVHEAIARRDLDEYARRMDLMVGEHRRAYAHFPNAAEELSTREIAGFFAKDLRVRPLEPNKLHFEPRADGRIAHVTHIDGGYVIEAVTLARGEVDERIRTDLTFTFHDGAWRVVR